MGSPSSGRPQPSSGPYGSPPFQGLAPDNRCCQPPTRISPASSRGRAPPGPLRRRGLQHDGLLEDAVHHALKCGGRVGEAKEHDIWHKDAELCLKRRFMSILPSDVDVIVALAHVKFCEDAGVSDASNSWGNKRHWIEVSLHQCICFLIVLDWPV
jgi:hypothetical protein